ncbi:MAG: cysteine--tRNA ligase [Eubacteriales bacterium]|nr:cysteine--tRNA ligase [Eubacteriales bacterium]
MIRLYNSLTRTNEELKPINGDLVKMYSCGPTVYMHPHIGNMRAYIFMDTLRRVIKYNGYRVLGCMNITDVGHLTDDADDGEDKMEKSAKRENKSPYEIAKYYTDIFLDNLKMLNIDIPEHITKATEYVPQMIEFIKKLEEKGYTYIIDDGVYFDVSKFKDYGKLSNKNMDEIGVARVEENSQKKHPFDFALWKFVPENHIMKWDSPWGVGCPGWHIECSAMGYDVLGDHFDIHTGGIDHLPIHHENEIAQSNCALGHRVVEIWMHNEFVLVDGGKMGKSLGNCYTLEQLKEKGFDPLAFKLFCLNTNYGKTINFTFDGLKASQSTLENLKKIVAEHKNGSNTIDPDKLKKYKENFLNAVNDNLNTPLALGVLFSMLRSEPKSKQIYDLAIDFDRVFGLKLDEEIKSESQSIPDEIKDLASKRWQAKQDKDWALADKLRAEVTQKGYQILDTKDGYTIKQL